MAVAPFFCLWMGVMAPPTSPPVSRGAGSRRAHVLLARRVDVVGVDLAPEVPCAALRSVQGLSKFRGKKNSRKLISLDASSARDAMRSAPQCTAVEYGYFIPLEPKLFLPCPLRTIWAAI